ncbi:flagellar protein FliT [Psychrobacillus vulpis]|uniref:Flagellar protein FliT n=1 Tax=Psychrobacillus vulpis TaxID=2325572 RepID=A0A544TIV5_9BACI|nr:flagellar protein FliT [Psychrobacillus vulpis]TQR17387.1 flagellar protein FliT [Psychrobacillus vulpis]
MSVVEDLLVASEALLVHLDTIPSEDKRDEFIERIEVLLDERENFIRVLSNLKEFNLENDTLKDRVIELDKDVINRLNKVMSVIKGDISELQQMKRREKSYSNPYAATQTIDGIYFDNKK